MENCVGSYRWCGDEEQAEAAEEVVEVLKVAIEAALMNQAAEAGRCGILTK